MKIRKKILLGSGVILTLIIFLINILFINPFQLNIICRQHIDNRLPASFNDKNVVFFSDLYFKTTSHANLKELVTKINVLQPDILLFGGDLIDPHYAHNLTNEQRSAMTDCFNSLQAKYGKYAVLGDQDYLDDVVKNQAESILIEGGFTILTNKSVLLFNEQKAAIRIVGIDSLIGGQVSLENAYDNHDFFTIAFTHCPDLFAQLPTEKTALTLAGHTRGGQIYLPFLERLYRPEGGKKYFRGAYFKDQSELYVSNGVGTDQKSIRLWADAEIVSYQLHN